MRLTREVLRQAMAAMGSKGGKTAAKNMTAAERSARAKKASRAAARKRTADRLARERARERKPKRGELSPTPRNP
jgi:hypothetical protein